MDPWVCWRPVPQSDRSYVYTRICVCVNVPHQWVWSTVYGQVFFGGGRDGHICRRNVKRCERVNEQKTYKRGDRVTVLGLVCEKMAKRVAHVRKESDERQAATCLARMQVLEIPVRHTTLCDTGVDQGA